MATDDPSMQSEYLQYLPAAFQADPEQGAFLGRFLLAFQRLLSGAAPTTYRLGAGAPVPDPATKPYVNVAYDGKSGAMVARPGVPADASCLGIAVAADAAARTVTIQQQPLGFEQILDRIWTYFLPGPGLPDDQRAPEAFLPWLASWVATSLREDWDAETKRRFIASIPSLYRARGTIDCMRRMLATFLDYEPEKIIVDDSGDDPYHFVVCFMKPVGDASTLARLERGARAIIEQEKPAHTYYELQILAPMMQIVDAPTAQTGPGIIVGKTTLLGLNTKTSR